MNLQFTQEELNFQKEVKDWIKENCGETGVYKNIKNSLKMEEDS